MVTISNQKLRFVFASCGHMVIVRLAKLNGVQVRNLRQLADEVVKIEQQTNHESMMTFELVNGDVVVIPVEEAIEANEEIMKRNKIAKRMNFRE
ncbi:hypothetical protein Pmar_PMAR015639 [Perkinsus marinus ATCC 50983]|uniref:Protease Do-like PDZ domain-containing protein n=1 Tax=Perkinsus marinus (strain ATCC 50983 / TXsc) TaxID=423536 RepID=C5K483_PERM5|nr:hypothetical protein Pmar_PMAR015639 [Perkinsus marinus ATCC 50983]EER20699.1 hypothetical protein Pmar_PMAR015639 [Perkinsus marinus ATCC 50983]|eukprot:XP_002788903.1 hypothetical protein Pmar_PMAR015639 [Perkinsus marinus ATCC 50983]